MVMKAYLKTIYRMFRRHFVRFINIVAIIIVSIGFMSGIGEVEGKIKLAVSDAYREHNISDIFIKGDLKEEDCRLIEDKMYEWGFKDISYALSYDEKIDGEVIRFYFMNLNNPTVNKFNLVEGSLPKESNQVLAERATYSIKGYEIGEIIELNLNGAVGSYEVVGIIENPLILIKKEEPSYIEGENLDNVIYFSTTPPKVSDVYLTLGDRTVFQSFSKEYNGKIAELKGEIGKLLPGVRVLGLAENNAIASLDAYAEKVGLISIVFVVFFLFVTALVVFSNMTRLIDEERGQIACMKTLGFSGGKILLKYLLFIGFATLLGGLVAFPVGFILTKVVYKSFGSRYLLPKMPKGGSYLYFTFSCLIILISSLTVTFFVGIKTVKTKPAVLLVPKAPSAGKKTLLEKVPFIWNWFSFKYKSSIRNVFLFKSRFFMTVISVIGSTVLVLAGFGLLDNVLKNSLASVIIIISIALIAFAGALCILVVYNIASISISERKREIATLKVLGYHNIEVVGYVFREIFITNLIGAILGVPVGYAFLKIVFRFIKFGGTADINWWTWILAPVVTLIFTAVTIPLLYKKIVKTDMNASLKAVE